MRALGLLLVMALAGAVFVPAVSAEEQNEGIDKQINSNVIFEITNYTNEFETGVTSGSKNADSLTDQYGKLNIPSTIEKYDIVQFDEVDMKTGQKNSVKVTLYDKKYTMELERMNFENIDDGIDSYSGSINGIDDSIVIFTFDKNLIYGTIQLEDEIIFIKPVQNREYAMKTTMPLHIVYSSKEMKQPSESEIAELEKLSAEKSMTPEINSLSDLSGAPLSLESLKASKGWESVYILVATDEEFYDLESNWVSSAQSCMAQAAYQYQRSDIEVFLNVAEYDASKKDILSSSARRLNDPLGLFKDTFDASYLNSKNADIAIYLGGNDRVGTAQGAAWGFQAFLNGDLLHCRYAWSQMVDDADTIDLYDGSYHARVYCINHEIGHIFFASHENSGGTNQAYVWFESVIIPKNTVMWSIYKGSITTQWEYSSPSYHGDSDHNNAGSISLAKSYVADYYV